jgi:hypothetical protein
MRRAKKRGTSTVNSGLSGLMMGRRHANNLKMQTIQNILFGAFTKLHKLLSIFFFFTTDVYFEK